MIAIAASTSYLTPLEPACLMVYGPGRYRFLDFVKVGGLLTLPTTCSPLARRRSLAVEISPSYYPCGAPILVRAVGSFQTDAISFECDLM